MDSLDVTQHSKLQGIPRESKSLHTEIDRLNESAWSFRNTDVRSLHTLSQQAYDLAISVDYKRGISKSLLCLAICRNDAEDLRGGIDLIEQALALRNFLNDPLHEMSCYHAMGMSYYFLGDYASSIQCLVKAKSIGRTHGEKGRVNAPSATINMAYHALGDMQSAFDGYTELMSECEDVGDQMNYASCLTNLGVLYYQIGMADLAMECQYKALDISRKLGAARLEVLCREYIVTGLLEARKFDEATEQNRIFYELAREQGFEYYECSSLLKGASIACEQQNLNEAFEILNGVEQRTAHTDHHLLLVELHQAYAHAHLSKNDFCRARESICRAITVAEETGLKARVVSFLATHASICEKLGDFEEAFRSHKRLALLEKELHQENSEKRLTALAVRRIVREAEQEASLLRQQSQQLADEEAALQRQAQMDPLTGLRNRRALDIWLGIGYHECRELGHSMAVAVVDVDHFKTVNDRFSHQTGDLVLTRVAQIFRSVCGDDDLVARFGGEEFVLGFSDCAPETAAQICERVRVEVASFPWHTIQSELRVTVSLGLCSDTRLGSYEKMLQEADRQLYRAKREGRNRLCFTEPDMQLAASR